MLRKFFLFLLLLQVGSIYSQTKKEVWAYYPTWRVYTRAGFTKPYNVQYEKYDVLIYFAFKADSAANIVSVDWWADSMLLGNRVGAYFNHDNVVKMSHAKNTKVVACIGGWGISDDFPGIATSPKLRAKFAHSCMELIRKHDFDGIDIDWEFPTDPDMKGTPADTKNFTLMMKAIRDSLDTNGKYLLSGAFGADPNHLSDIDWDGMIPLLDKINLMNYAYMGSWNQISGHMAPLYNPDEGYKGSVDSSCRYFETKWSVPKEKIMVGVSFSGFSLGGFKEGSAGLFKGGHSSKGDTILFPPAQGGTMYYTVKQGLDSGLVTEHWDEQSKCVYYLNKDKTTFISAENEKSITAKSDYVLSKDYGGIFIWDLTGDYVQLYPGSYKLKGTPLLDIINKKMKGK